MIDMIVQVPWTRWLSATPGNLATDVGPVIDAEARAGIAAYLRPPERRGPDPASASIRPVHRDTSSPRPCSG